MKYFESCMKSLFILIWSIFEIRFGLETSVCFELLFYEFLSFWNNLNYDSKLELLTNLQNEFYLLSFSYFWGLSIIFLVLKKPKIILLNLFDNYNFDESRKSFQGIKSLRNRYYIQSLHWKVKFPSKWPIIQIW